MPTSPLGPRQAQLDRLIDALGRKGASELPGTPAGWAARTDDIARNVDKALLEGRLTPELVDKFTEDLHEARYVAALLEAIGAGPVHSLQSDAAYAVARNPLAVGAAAARGAIVSLEVAILGAALAIEEATLEMNRGPRGH